MEPLVAAGHHPLLTTALVLLGVAVLALLRAWTWVRKERVLRRVGLDLHVPDAEEARGRDGVHRTDEDFRRKPS